MSASFLEVEDVHKSYFLNGKRIDVLRGVTVGIEKGELVSLIGASGSGKSTFLHVVGTLDLPASGQLRFKGKSVFDMNDAAVAEFRNRSIGFVFQSHFLLPEFTAEENVAMPALFCDKTRRAHSSVPASCWSASGWRSAQSTSPVSCRAVSRSAWRWRVR